MSWRNVALARSLGEFRATWDALNARYYNGHPFNDSRFVELLLRYFGTGREQVFVHEKDSAIDGLVILVPIKPAVWQMFIPAQLQAAPMLIPHAGLIRDLFKAIPWSVQLLELLNRDPSFSTPKLFEASPCSLITPHALTMNVALDGDFEAYWGGRSRKLVQNLRRLERHVVEEFGVNRFVIINQPSDIASAVSRYASLESNGWKGKEGTALNPENVQGQFYLALMCQFAESGQAQVVEYWLGTRLAASRLMISGGGIEIMLKTTYDETLAKFAPGRLLLKQYLQHAFASKVQPKVEFYTNATRDQLAWATGQLVISHISVFRFAWQARLYARYQRFKHKPDSASEAIVDSKVEALADLTNMSKSTQALLRIHESDSFDLGADWFHLLATCALTEAETPRYYISTHDNAARCVLPLLQRGKQVTGLTTFYTSLFRPAIAVDIQVEEAAAVFQRVIADTHASSIRLDAMAPEHSSFTLTRDAMHLAGLTTFQYFSFGNWYLPVNNRSFDDYLAGLSSKTRNTLKRKEKKFFANGVGHVDIFTNLDGLDPAIAAWEQIYNSSWKKQEPFLKFMPNLIRLCAGRGWLRMGLAYYKQTPIAAQIWIVNGGRAAIYKLAYDEAYTQHSAGTILTAHLMRHVLDIDKVAEVDYLVGDDEYKKDWVSHRRERWGIIGYNPRTLSGLVGLGIQLLGALRQKNKTQKRNT